MVCVMVLDRFPNCFGRCSLELVDTVGCLRASYHYRPLMALVLAVLTVQVGGL